MACTLLTIWPAICFSANIAFITLELALVTLVWAFSTAGRLVAA